MALIHDCAIDDIKCICDSMHCVTIIIGETS